MSAKEKPVKSDVSSKSNDKKEQCSKCKGRFVNLAKHNCKILEEIDKPNDKNKLNKPTLPKKEKPVKSDILRKCNDGKEQCLTCNGQFVNLAKHNCKVSEEVGKPYKKDDVRKKTLAKNEKPVKSDDEKEQCLTCNGRFVNLAKHNCKVSEKVGKPYKKDDVGNKTLVKNQKPVNSDVSSKTNDEKEQCLTCNGQFVNLAKHNCKVSEEVVKPYKKVDVRKKTLAKNEKPVKSDVSSKTNDEKEQCLTCNDRFVNLAKHNCKKLEEIAKPNEKNNVDKKEQCLKCERTKEKEVVAKPTFSKDPMKDIKSRLNDDKIARISSATVATTTTKIYKALTVWLNENDEYFKPWKAVTTGSSYEKLKIKEPDEFDVMFVATGIKAEHKCNTSPSCSIEQTFCKMVIDSRTNLPPDMCNKNANFLSPKAFKSYFRKMFLKWLALDDSTCIKGLKRHIEIVNDDIKGSPALQIAVQLGDDTINIDLVPSLQVTTWPGHSKSSKSTWVSGDIKKECHAVCKLHTSEFDKEASECVYWRLSFSHVEKQMMLHADGNNKKTGIRTCRKGVLKVIKSLLCDVKIEMEKKNTLKGRQPVISSYHCKTLMFHCYDDKYKDEDWSDEVDNNQLRTMLKETLSQFIQHLEKKNLPHYFVPAVNLLQKMTQAEKDFLIEKFKYFFNYY